MRTWALVPAVLLVAAFSGCLSEETEDPGDSAPTEPPAPPPYEPPEDITETQLVPAGADPSTVAMENPCTTNPEACYRYPISLAEPTHPNQTVNVAMAATLTWGIDANDFDLHVYRGSSEIGSSTSPAAPLPGGSNTERVDLTLTQAGSYEVVVVAWGSVADTFELVVRFTGA